MKAEFAKKAVKRICAVILALCMITALCPAAFAVTEYNVWVNGTQLTGSNSGSLLGGTVKYDHSSKTLTLSGANITKGVPIYDSGTTVAIYSVDSLNIVLKGNNKISGTGFGVASNGALKFSGTGSLEISSSGDDFSSIFSGGNVDFSECSVTAAANGTNCFGILADGVVNVSKGASVALSVKGSNSCGVLASNNIVLNGGYLSAATNGDSSGAILSQNDINISGGGAASATVTGSECFGVFAGSGVSISNGRLASDASGATSTGIGASSVSLTSGSITAFGTESAAFIEGSGIAIGSGSFTIREGDNAPGSVVSSLTDTDDFSDTFTTKKYIQLTNGAEVIRFGGVSRYATAALISNNWASADNIVLANGTAFADALAGVPLAYALDAPILLIDGESIESGIMARIKELGAKNIYLLGGEVAISSAVEKQLKNGNYNVERIAGDSRFGTAVAIAYKLASITGKAPDSVFFANGYNYPDTLAVSSAAAIQGKPVLYAPDSGALDAVTKTYLTENGIDSAVVLGGEVAVGSDVYGDIGSVCTTLERIFGSDRYETAAAIIGKYSSTFTGKGITVATGMNYPDALAGAVFAAKQGLAVMLVPDTLDADTRTENQKQLISKDTDPIYVFGGQNAVSETVIAKLLG